MNTETRLRLEELLDREIDGARALALALTAERAALTGDEPAAVHAAAAAKIRLLGTIEGLEAERRALWAGLGTAAPTASADGRAVGVQAAASPAAAAPATVAERWRALLELMAGCRTANEVNGHIIHTRQHQIRQLIDIVRGGAPVTYGPQGKTFARALRALARA